MDIEEIRQKKQEELQKKQELQDQINQLEAAVKQLMTKSAVERYNTLKVAHTEKAIQFLTVAAQLAQKGQLQEINDEVMKRLLTKMEQKRETKIRFVR